MKRVGLRADTPETAKKVEQVLAETVVRRVPFSIEGGIWKFVVYGPSADGLSVIRVGNAEQMTIQASPVYLATVGGDYIPDSEGVPIEEFAGDDMPDELQGLKIFHLSPMRPLSITTKKQGPPIKAAASEVPDFYNDENTAIIETPDESYWALSVLKYLDESDRFFPDPVLTNFYSRLGGAVRTRSGFGPYAH